MVCWSKKLELAYKYNGLVVFIDFFLGAKDFDQLGKVGPCILQNPSAWGPSGASSTYSLFNSDWKLMKILSGAPSSSMGILSGASFHPNTYSLFKWYAKLMEILSGASFLPQYMFLIQFVCSLKLSIAFLMHNQLIYISFKYTYLRGFKGGLHLKQ